MKLPRNLKRKLRMSLGVKTSLAIVILIAVLTYLTVQLATFSDTTASNVSAVRNLYSIGRTTAQLIDQDRTVALYDDALRKVGEISLDDYGDISDGDMLLPDAGYSEDPEHALIVKDLWYVMTTCGLEDCAFVVDIPGEENLYLVAADSAGRKPGSVCDLRGSTVSDDKGALGITDARSGAMYVDNESYGGVYTYVLSPFYRTDDHKEIMGYVLLADDLAGYAMGTEIYRWIFIPLIVVIMLIFWLVFVRLIRRVVVKPIRKMATAATAYSEQEDKIDGPSYFQDLGLKSNDELKDLGDAMALMETRIHDYMEHLQDVTREKERTETELEVAARIQASMLPDGPCNNEGFSIHSFMRPAKEVGGDFYDYFDVGDGKVAIVISDVSGKGIPAALFMAVSKSVIKTTVLEHGDDLEKALYKINDFLCERNDEMMFVTTFVGIYSKDEGTLTYINAGHEDPIIYRKETGRYDFIMEEHDLMLGASVDASFTGRKISLSPGDILFVYTDGLTDATNPNEEMFSAARITATLNEDTSRKGSEIITCLWDAVNGFENGHQQFDDITMVVLEVK